MMFFYQVRFVCIHHIAVQIYHHPNKLPRLHPRHLLQFLSKTLRVEKELHLRQAKCRVLVVFQLETYLVSTEIMLFNTSLEASGVTALRQTSGFRVYFVWAK